MSFVKLADPTKPTFSKAQGPVQASGLWTSRSPILLPPPPIPGQRDNRISAHSSSPAFPRSEFGLCTNERGDVYFYGGETKGRSDELYHYSVKKNTITPLQCSGTSPGRRACHAMTLAGNVIALHGGHSGKNDPDLYLLNLVSREWSRVTTSGDAPECLRYHGMTAVGTTIYIFGGYNSNSGDSDKLWAFDLNALHAGEPRWELIKPSSQAQPTARFASTLLAHHGQLILFGGYGGRYFTDVWSFDTKSRGWNELQCAGDVPPPRCGHTAAILDDVMYIVAGKNWSSSRLNDIFAFKMPEQRWFKLRNTDITPVPRNYPASVCIGTQIFIFGGNTGQESEKHPMHTLNANYIDNPDLHTPERLEEIDIEFQVMLSQEKPGSDSQETEISKRSQIVSYILRYPPAMDSLARSERADAQMIIDFLADELVRLDILQSNTDKRHILHFLNKLAKSAQVFPKSTELSHVQCNLSTPVNDEGGYGFIYKGVFGDQVVCVKAVRVTGSSSGKRSRGSKRSQEDESSREYKRLRAQAGEAVLLGFVTHPNIIPLYGTYLSSEEIPRICIVSPWMENGDLATYLIQFPDTPIIPLACDMAAGLGYLHDMGIVHANLKAANVLVSQSHRALLADFGISTVLHTNVGTTTAGDYAGTTWWMAPELLVALAENEPPPPTKESDIWGFACVCYEMFAGEIPFLDRGFKPMRLMMAFLNGRKITPLRPNGESNPIDVDDDPISVDDEPWIPLAERCWSYEPSERPAAGEALEFLTGLNVRDNRPSMDEELAKFKAIKDIRVKVDIDYGSVLSVIQNASEAAITLERSRIIAHILKHKSKVELFAQLQKADSQMIVDFLANELGREEIVQSNTHKRHILHFLSRLAKTAQVFPKSTELSGVECNLSTPVNDEGGFGFIYKGVFGGQQVCVKAVRVNEPAPKAGRRLRGGKKRQEGKSPQGDDTSQGDKKLRAQAGEIVLLAHVSHLNVIPLYGTYLSDEESPRICIVSPWMEYGNLIVYLREFPEAPIIPLASDMADGLSFLHDMGIIHADLKAANVLVSQSHRALLADFGIATVWHTNVGTMTVGDYAGSTWWMAPELIIAAAKHEPPPPTKESDMWGFACICYEMFADGIPFADRRLTSIYLTTAFNAGRGITPLRPDEESEPIDVDGDPVSVDDEPWIPLAERCWNYDARKRPTAAEAWQFLVGLNVQDNRPSMDEELAMFNAIKDSRVKVDIDYSHVLSIVQNTT